MNREHSFPNFNAAQARSNSSSRVPDYFFSATSSHHNRYADPFMSNLQPLHIFATVFFWITTLTTPFSRMALSRFSVGSSSRTCTATSCANSHKQAQTRYRLTPRARRTFRRTPTRTSIQKCSSILPSSTLCLGCAIP